MASIKKEELKEIIKESVKSVLKEAGEKLTDEQKVDMWNNRTRPVKYKLASEDKLRRYYNIALSKGYDRITDELKGYFRKQHILRDITGEPDFRFYEHNEHELVNYFGDATEIVIPEQAEGTLPQGWYRGGRRKEVTKITLPKGITELDSWCLSGFEGLKEINTENIKKIDTYEVFENCKSLTKLDLSNATGIGSVQTFRGCDNLKEIIIGKNLSSVYNNDYSILNTKPNELLEGFKSDCTIKTQSRISYQTVAGYEGNNLTIEYCGEDLDKKTLAYYIHQFKGKDNIKLVMKTNSADMEEAERQSDIWTKETADRKTREDVVKATIANIILGSHNEYTRYIKSEIDKASAATLGWWLDHGDPFDDFTGISNADIEVSEFQDGKKLAYSVSVGYEIETGYDRYGHRDNFKFTAKDAKEMLSSKFIVRNLDFHDSWFRCTLIPRP